MSWSGVFPAVTTKFHADESLNVRAMESHIKRQLAAGVDGIIVLGSLGENATLSFDEKIEVVKLAASITQGKVPLLSTVAETTTKGACRFAEAAAAAGAQGFMLLHGMLYPSDPRETMTHFRAVAKATDRDIMLYNNPMAYRVDVTPEMFAELADESRFVAIKESSDDVRRVTDIRNLVGDRYRLFTGVDDLALESLMLGADGWVAGLVCAFPEETVALYKLAKAGRIAEALPIYRWFMPLLHLDVNTKFVQNIKLAEAMAGPAGSEAAAAETVRAPRLILAGDERAKVEAIIRRALETRPTLPVL